MEFLVQIIQYQDADHRAQVIQLRNIHIRETVVWVVIWSITQSKYWPSWGV